MFPDEVIHDENCKHDKQNACHLAKPCEHLVDGRLPFLHLHLDRVWYGVMYGYGVGLGVVDDFEPILEVYLGNVDGVAFRKNAYAIVQINAIRLDEAVSLAYIPIHILRDRDIFYAPASCQRHEHHGQHSEREPLQPISSHIYVVLLLLLKEPIGLPFSSLDKAVELSASCVDPPHELCLDALVIFAILDCL